MRYTIKVIPRSSRCEIIDCREINELGPLKEIDFKVYLKSAPIKGKANSELIALFTSTYGWNVRVVSGNSSSKKIIEIIE